MSMHYLKQLTPLIKETIVRRSEKPFVLINFVCIFQPFTELCAQNWFHDLREFGKFPPPEKRITFLFLAHLIFILVYF